MTVVSLQRSGDGREAATSRLASGLFFLMEPFERAWQFRELIRAVVRRELKSRFRDSFLGWVWAIFAPLALLAAYTTMFSITAPGIAGEGTMFDYAASCFAGLVVFNVFAELLSRAPTLLHEHANLVKKSIFPSETVAWTSTIRAFVYGGISFVTMLITLQFIGKGVSWMVLWTPLIILPYFLLMLGTVWILMALGAFTKDVSHLVATISPLLMFVTPIFFKVDQVPESLLPLIRANLVGNYVEIFRDIVMKNAYPDPRIAVPTILASFAVFYFGYRFFRRYRSVIVDVI